MFRLLPLRRPGALALTLAVAATSLLLSPSPAAAQFDGLTTNPALGWATIRTPHFRIHYEPGLRAWAEQVATRIESVREAVVRKVGYTPPAVIDILIEDPLNVPNGSAWPTQLAPAMRFWATPPDPSSGLGNARSWSEILSVHEFAHLAHLLRPSRNAGVALNSWLAPVVLGPIPIGAPGWVIEGYATLIEGQLTGAGRPNGTLRPALLRQWAIEGALPSYDQLDATGPFFGGAMRYLVGSAFLEWLERQRGDSSLVWLWRRMTARQTRSFDAAFTGTFGEPARVLYGRFVAEVTVAAKAAEREITAPAGASGAARGAWRQHFRGAVGAPAVSPTGDRVALRLAAPGSPTRVVIFDTVAATDPRDSARAARNRSRDSLDVPDYVLIPKGWKRVATLSPIAGGGFGAPRWFADGERLLVVRQQPLGDGRSRPDLWMWHAKSGWTRRITTGEGIREADPLPSGAQAAGLSCGGGTCHLVLIDLVTGGVRRVATGAVDRPFAGVRVSPDGARIASTVQVGATWRPVVVEIATGTTTFVGPDDGATRYSPTWAGDTALVVVSEASGVANLERIALAGPITPLTRTTGAASAPEVARNGAVWFLDLHSRGYDLRSLSPDAVAPVGATAVLSSEYAPAAPKVDQSRAVTFTEAPVPPARGYGMGPLAIAPMTFGATAADGNAFGLAFNVTDPVGRVALLANAGFGRQGAWQGGRLGLAYRGLRPELQVQGWVADHRPSRQGPLGGARVSDLDASYSGGVAALALARQTTHGQVTGRLGGSLGQLEYGDPQRVGFVRGARTFGFATLGGRYAWTPGGLLRIGHELTLHGASGTTNGTTWQRGVVEAVGSVSSWADGGLAVRGRYGVTSGRAPAWERFTYGGSPSPYVESDLLAQRIVSPGLPFAMLRGSRLATLAVETTGPLRLYHEWVTAGETLGRFNRFVGLEINQTLPPVSVLRLPSLGVRTGITYSTDAPFRRRTMGFVLVTLAP